MNKFIKNIQKNKYLYLILIIIFIILVYTHLNTYLANDDLPYMFLYRTDVRVDSLIDAIKNQVVDYFYISGRICVHTILQAVLIFDKKLWSFTNPIMILSTILLIIKIIEINNKKVDKILSLLAGVSLYLLLFKYKKIIYWVAGSVNYVWVFTFLILILYLYYKYGFHKNKYLNTIIIFILCMIHECTMVFTIVFIIGSMIVDWYKNKKFNKDYFLYLVGLTGSLVLLLSPANQNRLISDELWNNYNLIEKLMISIPIISKNLLNISEYKTLLSYIFIISIITLLLKNKDKISMINIILIFISIILIYCFNNNWLYFILVLLLCFGENYTYLKHQEYQKIVLSLSFYAVVYFNVITPTYFAGRPNYYFYMYIIYLALDLLNKNILANNNFKKINYFLIPIITITLLINEINIYYHIGNYYNQRINQINEYLKEEKTNTLYLTKIPEKYADYHMDLNLPNKDWFNYNSFINYYNLPKNIDIIYIDKE